MKLSYCITGPKGGQKMKSIKADDFVSLALQYASIVDANPEGTVSHAGLEVAYEELDSIFEQTRGKARLLTDTPRFYDELTVKPRFLKGAIGNAEMVSETPLPLPVMNFDDLKPDFAGASGYAPRGEARPREIDLSPLGLPDMFSRLG